MEKWKPVKWYEENYEVSTQGRVRSKDKRVSSGIRHNTSVIKYGRTLKPSLKKGYLTIMLYTSDRRRTMSIHRLVALTFIPNPEQKPQVNHINGIKTDNRAINLEWVTALENNVHAIENQLRGKSSLRKKIKCIETDQVFNSSYEAAEWLNRHKYQYTKKVSGMGRNIRAAASGKRPRAYGYKWLDI